MIYKFVWADGKVYAGPKDETQHDWLWYDNIPYGHNPKAFVSGEYDPDTQQFIYPLMPYGLVPSEDQLKAEIEKAIFPDHTGSYFLETIASDRYTGEMPQVVHVPTGDMGEPLGRVPGIYDSYNNRFYHGDRGGSHYNLVNHIYRTDEDAEDYNDYLGEGYIPTIYFPKDTQYGGKLDWAARIKPEIQRHIMDAMEHHMSNPTHQELS